MPRIIKSLTVAFSMYSRIPMPKAEWDENNMRWSLICLPVVGAVCGALMYAAFALGLFLRLGVVFTAAILTLVPLVFTGGIHFDGFCDTCDALACHSGREKRLLIMKDPHVGAFGVTYTVAAILAIFGAFSFLNSRPALLAAVCFAPVISRAFSALLILKLPKAAADGLAQVFSKDASPHSEAILIAIIAASAALCAIIAGPIGLSVPAAGFVVYLICKHICRKDFGGVTGDIAGFNIILSGVCCSAAAAIVSAAAAMF